MSKILEMQQGTEVATDATRWSGLSISGCSGFSGASLIGCGK
jgi:hypothetical protein